MNNLNDNKITPNQQSVENPTQKVTDNQVLKPVDKLSLEKPIEKTIINSAKEVTSEKQNKLYFFVIIIVCILILIGASYLGRNIRNSKNKVGNELINNEISSDYDLDGNICHDRANYFIVTRADLSGDAGDDILIKHKTSEDKNIECQYKVAEGDFELLNNRSEGFDLYSHNQFFSYIKDNFLVLNEGTGTNRTVRVFDLEKQQDVFSDNYHGELDLQDSTLIYWRVTKDIPNQENCSKINEYKKNGMGAQIETKVFLNLTDLTKEEFKEFRCLQSE